MQYILRVFGALGFFIFLPQKDAEVTEWELKKDGSTFSVLFVLSVV